MPGGRLAFNGTPIFYTAAFQQQGLGLVPAIHSEYRSQSFELNDTIRWKRLDRSTPALLASNDTLLRPGPARGRLEAADRLRRGAGQQVRDVRHPVQQDDPAAPGATWAYNGTDTVFASYATYNPAASSLPRAASWDRNLATTINAHFDANGVLFGSTNVASSSGKLFVDGHDAAHHRRVRWSARRGSSPIAGPARAYWRYRKGSHFWEDTNNNARVAFRTGNTPASVPSTLYIADLTAASR